MTPKPSSTEIIPAHAVSSFRPRAPQKTRRPIPTKNMIHFRISSACLGLGSRQPFPVMPPVLAVHRRLPHRQTTSNPAAFAADTLMPHAFQQSPSSIWSCVPTINGSDDTAPDAGPP